jgi:hypothetical protein
MRRPWLAAPLPLFLVFVAGCAGGEDASASSPVSPSTTPPSLTSTSVSHDRNYYACEGFDRAIAPVSDAADTAARGGTFSENTLSDLDTAVVQIGSAGDMASGGQQATIRNAAVHVSEMNLKISLWRVVQANGVGQGALDVARELTAISRDVDEMKGWCRTLGFTLTHQVKAPSH